MKQLTVLIAFVLGSTAASAQSHRRSTTASGLDLRWEDRCFTYSIGPTGNQTSDGVAEAAAIEAAFQTWQTVANGCGSGWRYIRGPRAVTSELSLGATNAHAKNVVFFRQLNCRDVVPMGDKCEADPETAHSACGNKYRCFYQWTRDGLGGQVSSDGALAVTSTQYNKNTGVIQGADVEFNATPKEGGGTASFFGVVGQSSCGEGCDVHDLQNTMTHELGHAMGFDHVDDFRSTMFRAAGSGEVSKRVVDTGTAAGFCSIYTPTNGTPCDDLVEGSTALRAPSDVLGGCSSVGGEGLLLGVLAGVLALLRRRARD